eukprot:3874940-Pleurochrysis_carterae.AAC.1
MVGTTPTPLARWVVSHGGYTQSPSANPILSERGLPVRSSKLSLDWGLSFDHFIASLTSSMVLTDSPRQRTTARSFSAMRASPG